MRRGRCPRVGVHGEVMLFRLLWTKSFVIVVFKRERNKASRNVVVCREPRGADMSSGIAPIDCTRPDCQ
jgi:proline racemase